MSAVLLAATLGLGCTVFEPTPPPPPSNEPPRGAKHGRGHSGRPSEKDGAEISRAEGQAGGVVVFWPRIIPRDDDPTTRDLAAKVQARLDALVRKTLPDAAVEVRPEPERVCPQAGCKAMTVGVLLTRDKESCAALALVGGPGASPSRIVPWAGDAKLARDTVGFREPPENQVKISDFVRCDKLVDGLAAREGDVAAAIRAAAGK